MEIANTYVIESDAEAYAEWHLLVGPIFMGDALRTAQEFRKRYEAEGVAKRVISVNRRELAKYRLTATGEHLI